MTLLPTSDSDGLGLNELRLEPCNPAWRERFDIEAEKLRYLAHVISVEHIGSTVFPDVVSKPVVDIAVMVDTQPDHSSIRESFVKLGYTHHGEFGLPGRIFYTLGHPPVVHVHVVTCGSSYWPDWLTFRNYLMQHPAWRKRYETEKLRLLEASRGDRRTYTAMKAPFIQYVINVAHGKTEHDETKA